MNRLAQSIQIFACVLVLGTQSTAGYAAELTVGKNRPTIRFCYQDTELYPAYLGNGREVPSDKPGVDIELYQKIAEQAGGSVTFIRYSWNRCLALLSAGRIDSVISSFRPERAKIAKFPMRGDGPDPGKRITTSGYFLYHLDKGVTYWDGQKLLDPSISIGAPMGYSIVADLQKWNANVTEAGTTKGLLNLLRYGRFDAIAAPGNMTDAIIRREITLFSEIVRDPQPLKQNPYFIVFSESFTKNNPSLVERIWQNTETVREEFREQILLKY